MFPKLKQMPGGTLIDPNAIIAIRIVSGATGYSVVVTLSNGPDLVEYVAQGFGDDSRNKAQSLADRIANWAEVYRLNLEHRGPTR